MPYLRDYVFVLKKEPFREQDRRYLMYGQEHGLLIAVARGSAAQKSKQAGHLEPFCTSEVMLASSKGGSASGGKGSAFDKLAVAKSSGKRPTLSLAGYAVLGRLAELVLALVHPGVSDVRIFYLLQETAQTFSSLDDEPSTERTRLMLAAASLKLLDFLGFAPNPAMAESAPANFIQIFSFIRSVPLKDSLRLTATKSELNYFSTFVEEAFRATHLENPGKIFGKTLEFLA